jgi:hypothetical protein
MKNIISLNGKFLTIEERSGERILSYPKDMLVKLLEMTDNQISKEEIRLIKEVKSEYNKLCKNKFLDITLIAPSQQKATAITMDEFNRLKEGIIFFAEFKNKLKKVNNLVNKFFPHSGNREWDYANAYYKDEKSNIRIGTVSLAKHFEDLDKFVLIAHNEAKQKTEHKSYALYFESSIIDKDAQEGKKGFISSRNSSLTHPTVLASAKLFETPEEVKKFAKVKGIDKWAVVEVDVKMKTVLEHKNTDAAEITSVIEKELVEDILVPSAENKKLAKMLQIIRENNLEHLLNEEEKPLEIKKRNKI